jgi:hypothetical protein
MEIFLILKRVIHTMGTSRGGSQTFVPHPLDFGKHKNKK